MSRLDIQYIKGGYYHIYNRGAHRRSIFHNDQDFLYVQDRLKTYAGKQQIAVIAYCHMPNHYHWLVRQDGEIEARWLPQRVFNCYGKYYHFRHKHSGVIFEGPFEAKMVDTDRYLRHLCRYIHLNPVMDGFAQAPELWAYSNFAEWLGTRTGTMVDHALIQAHFQNGDLYRQYVMDYLTGLGQAVDNLDYLQNW